MLIEQGGSMASVVRMRETHTKKQLERAATMHACDTVSRTIKNPDRSYHIFCYFIRDYIINHALAAAAAFSAFSAFFFSTSASLANFFI